MANENNKRFVYRTADKKKKTYLIPVDEIKSSPKIEIAPPLPPPVETPVRRVVIIRNAKNAKTTQEAVNLTDFNAEKTSPVISNNNKSVYFIRRSTTTAATKSN